MLATLRRSGPPYQLTPTRLYEELVLTSGAVTHRVDALERAGLVQRVGGRPDGLHTVAVNIGDRSQVAALFEQAQAVRHLVVTAADLPYGPVTELSEDSIMRAVRTKFLGPYFAAQEAAPA